VLANVLDQTDKIYNPYVSIVTSSFQDLQHYSNYDYLYEAFGEIDTFFTTNITLITNQTALQLLSLPPDTIMTIASNPSEVILFFNGPHWLANRWIFFVFFAISFFYALFHTILLRQRWAQFTFRGFCAGTFCSLLKSIELGVDPYFTTMLLTRPGNAFVNYYAIFCYVVSIFTVFTAWFQIVGGNDSFHHYLQESKFLNLFRRFFLCVSLPIFFLGLTCIALCYSLVFPGYTWVLIAAFGIIGIMLVFSMVVLVWVGSRVLLLIRRNLKGTGSKNYLLRKNTMVMFLQVLAFLILLTSLLIYVIVKPDPTLNTSEMNLAVYACENTGILLGLISAYYFFSIRKQQKNAKQGDTSTAEMTQGTDSNNYETNTILN